MAAVDDSGAPAGGAAPARMLGPYWRRKLGQTLPGEMTGPQLQRINLIRRAMGLPPAGGEVGLQEGMGTGAGGPNDNPARGADTGGLPTAEDLVDQYRNILQVHMAPGGATGAIHALRGRANEQAAGGIRQQILERLQGASADLAQAPAAARTSNRALHLMRGRGRQPILPGRKGLPY